MTSFLTHRAHVHDAGLPLHRRHSALRTCLTAFAPYGLRTTYHHLTLSPAIPRRLEADPDALVRAVEELHEARVLWLVRADHYAEQRRAEKQAGRRAVRTLGRGGYGTGGKAPTVPGSKPRFVTRRCACPSTYGGRTRFWTIPSRLAAQLVGTRDREC